MPVYDAGGLKLWQRRAPRESLFHWVLWLVGIAIFAYCWQQISKSTTWFFVWDAPRIADDIWTRATPPKWEYITQLGKPVWDTLNIATLGTIFALILAVPVAFLAASNTTPSRFIIRPIALLIIVSTRSINSLIWALLLIAIIGPGVFAGVIAIAIRSIGFCAKLLYEAIEEIDDTQVEAIKATGDINIRESTVLGLVGAGGIGLQLSASLHVLAWPQVSLILLVILAAVVISEWVSAKVRGAII